MNEKTIIVAALTKELLADLDKLFPEKTAEEIETLLEFYRWKESDLSIEKGETPVEEAKEVQDAHQNMLQQVF